MLGWWSDAQQVGSFLSFLTLVVSWGKPLRMGKRPYTVLPEFVEEKEKPSTTKGAPTASNRLRPKTHFAQQHFFLIQEKKK